MLFRRTKYKEIVPGARFRHQYGMTIGVAEVLSIQPDARGIPHVHFELEVGLPSGANQRRERRVLALQSFEHEFCQPA